MAKTVSESLIKSIEYLSLPWQYHGSFRELGGKIFSNRELTHELPRLTPYQSWFQGQGFKTILDVGAYIGAFAFAMRKILPEATIISFDPLEKNIDTIKKNMGDDRRFQVIQSAIGSRTGTVDFWVSDFTASSSILEMTDEHKTHFPESAGNRKITVPIRTLDECLESISHEGPTLLKVDVQGFELPVFEGARRTLKSVGAVITEVSFQRLYQDQPLFEEIHSALKKEGFAFSGVLDSLVSPLDGSILQADALFTRMKQA